ncbi:hypothetical protein F5Y07DRAFT_403392 [Xylaria sp. FL0933]|nr:hypothetical protein F5Y07DRAFT_403392 [Xylaria sp. FL0933]
MWLFPRIAVAYAVLSFGGITHGYLIDPESCSGDYQFVKDMVEQAFNMARIAVASVNTVPMDPDASSLLQQLFNVEGVTAKGLIEGVFAPGPANNKGEKTGILTFQDEITGSVESLGAGLNEVVIFCDRRRLQTRIRDPLHLYDRKANRAVSRGNPCTSAFMYTQTFRRHWDLIQICPWFLQYAKAKKYGTTKDISSLRAFLAVKWLDKLITKKFYTPLDLMSLWDKCMLHEMMHTKPGDSKDDSSEWNGYGWKNCKVLSTDPTLSKRNADSYAVFGSALYWAKAGSPIDENGNFISDPSAIQGNSRKRLESGRDEYRAKIGERGNQVLPLEEAR